MGHEELDKLFREIIQDDTNELTEQEVGSKAAIWAAIELPKKERVNFSFWKIAAAILFLLWGSTAYWFTNRTAKQEAQLQQWKQIYSTSQEQLKVVQEELKGTKCTVLEQSPKKPQEIVISKPIVQYLDKFVEIRDTIWIEKEFPPEVLVEYIRDTVWVETPVVEKNPSVLVQHESAPIPDIRKIPSKVAFIFGKQPLQTPTGLRIPLIINEHEITKKTEQHNNGLITVKIN